MNRLITKIILGAALIGLAGCASKEVDLDASPYSQAESIKEDTGIPF